MGECQPAILDPCSSIMPDAALRAVRRAVVRSASPDSTAVHVVEEHSDGVPGSQESVSVSMK
jgi:hypothetical protein